MLAKSGVAFTTSGIALVAGCTEEGDNGSASGGDSGGSDTSGDSSGGSTPTQSGAASAGGSGGSSGTTTPVRYANGQLAKVSEFTITNSDMGGPTLQGAVRNITGSELSYVQIQVAFLDGNRQVAEGLDNTNNLGAGIEWPFDAAALTTDAPPVTNARWEFTASGF